jgi:hypothetical protein
MDIFGILGSGLGDSIASAFQVAMIALWSGALDLLRAAFDLANQFSIFSVSTTSGPVKIVWPMMVWLSGLLAVGLFFWQLTMTSLKAGRGFVRVVTGPVQYGVALAVTVGLVGAFLAAVDGLTTGILSYGLQARSFSDALAHSGIAGAAQTGVKAIILGICAIVGVLPAAIGYVLEMLFREAAIYVLAAVIPIVAAGLLANVTASWFWRTVRWLLAAVVMKPVLALTLVLGVAIVGGAEGVAGLLAGVGVLIISLIAPFVLFRLFAFVDPNSDAGGAFRDFLSGAGMDSYGPNNPVSTVASAATGTSSVEEANTGRFDDALAYDGGGVGQEQGAGCSDDCGSSPSEPPEPTSDTGRQATSTSSDSEPMSKEPTAPAPGSTAGGDPGIGQNHPAPVSSEPDRVGGGPGHTGLDGGAEAAGSEVIL